MKRLHSLEPKEVSLVGKAANKKKFLVFKNSKGKQMSVQQEIVEMMKKADPKALKNLEKVVKAMMPSDAGMAAGDMPPKKDSSVYKLEGKEGEDSVDEHTMIGDRAQAALKAVGRILEPFKGEIKAQHLMKVAGAVGIGDDHAPGDVQGEEAPVDHMMKADCPEGVDPEHHAKAMGEAQKMYKAHLEKMGYRKHEDEQPEMKSMMKAKKDDMEEEEEEDLEKKVQKSGRLDLSAFPEAQRPHLEAIFKSNMELVKKNQDLEKELSHERDVRLEKEFNEKAAALTTHTGANKAEIVKIMKSMHSKDPEALKFFEAVLKAQNEQAKSSGLFKTVGSDRAAKVGDPASQIDAIVDGLVLKSGGKTKEQVYSEYIATPEGKKLYNEYAIQKRGGR